MIKRGKTGGYSNTIAKSVVYEENEPTIRIAD
jgi:hypothetical protein